VNTATFEVGIINDGHIESTEEFTVTIDTHPSFVPSGVVIGEPSEARIEILDDDSSSNDNGMFINHLL